MMSVTDVVARAQDALTVRRVFGEPIERDGVTIVPVARLSGAGGPGSGEGDPGGRTGPGWGSGSGGGYGLKAVPAGVFVIRNGTVCWRPALDVNRVILGGQLVAITAILALGFYLRRRARRAGSTPPSRPGTESPVPSADAAAQSTSG